MRLLAKATAGAVFVVCVVVVLALTCPDENSFKIWAKQNIAHESGSVVEQAKGAALSVQATWTADYEDHVLWATVNAYQGMTRGRFLGFMGTWFRLGDE